MAIAVTHSSILSFRNSRLRVRHPPSQNFWGTSVNHSIILAVTKCHPPLAIAIALKLLETLSMIRPRYGRKDTSCCVLDI